jgi:DNA-binding NarL/FixJ family response regulator
LLFDVRITLQAERSSLTKITVIADVNLFSTPVLWFQVEFTDREANITMNILIADDHANVRRGLREILADAFSGTHFSEASDGDEVLTELLKAQQDILLLDINMPGRSGMEVLKDVMHIYPQLFVIMVSVQPENQYALRCLRAGATAYVNKNSASDELAPAIKKILDSGTKSAWNLNGNLSKN